MDSPLVILLIEQSFLIREGFKILFSQMGLSFRMEETDLPVANLSKLIQRSQARLIMANPELLLQPIINRADPQFLGLTFIGLVKDKTPKSLQGQFDAVVNCSASRTELLETFEDVFRKQGYIDETQSEQQLSDRETEILRLVALGLTNNEIGEKLFISVHTVMTHRKNITRKLGIKTVSGLTVYAILNKLIMAEELKGNQRNDFIQQ
jgi:DNA-binding NarL/FixJ family response regulator